MKRGDKVDVVIAGHVVAQAEVREFGDGTATLIVPATMVVMGTRTDLTDLPREEPSTQTIITGVDRASGESAAVVESPSAPAPVQQVAPPAPVDNNASPSAPVVNDTSSGETVVTNAPGVSDATPGSSASAPASPNEQS